MTFSVDFQNLIILISLTIQS